MSVQNTFLDIPCRLVCTFGVPFLIVYTRKTGNFQVSIFKIRQPKVQSEIRFSTFPIDWELYFTKGFFSSIGSCNIFHQKSQQQMQLSAQIKMYNIQIHTKRNIRNKSICNACAIIAIFLDFIVLRKSYCSLSIIWNNTKYITREWDDTQSFENSPKDNDGETSF